MQTTDRDIASRVAELLQVSVLTPKNRNPGKWKDVYAIRLHGSRAIDLMRIIQPLMGLRRKEQINRAVNSYTMLRQHVSLGKTKRIKELRITGLSLRAIGRIVRCDHETVRKHCNK